MSKTILEEAKEILYERKQEKERQYGPFKESMEKAAKVASVLCGHNLSSNDIYCALIGVKLARQGFSHKRDNVLDAIVYMAQMNDENESKSHDWDKAAIFCPSSVDFSSKESLNKIKSDLKKAKSYHGRAKKVSSSVPDGRKKTSDNRRRKTRKTAKRNSRTKSIPRK